MNTLTPETRWRSCFAGRVQRSTTTACVVLDCALSVRVRRRPRARRRARADGAGAWSAALAVARRRLSSGERVCVVFHCEFSSQRGPALYRALRSWDRDVHTDCYPQLYYPELYLLKGGYKRLLHRNAPHHCEPQRLPADVGLDVQVRNGRRPAHQQGQSARQVVERASASTARCAARLKW
jgi:hypothetical protein